VDPTSLAAAVKEYSWAFTGLAAGAAALWAVFTYRGKVREDRRKAALARFEKFLTMRAEFWSDNSLRAVHSSPQASPGEKYSFMAFVEKIALMVQSDLMSIDIAFYVFGYHIIRIYENEEFWRDFYDARNDDGYWRLYATFSRRILAYSRQYAGRKFPVDRYRF
jgi:hypothetical protein